MRRVGHGVWLLLVFLALTAQSYPFNDVPDGAANAPSRAYRNDNRLGTFRKDGGTEGFVSDGTVIWHWSAARLHITGNTALLVGGSTYLQGAVGVGINDPTSALHVRGSIASTGTISAQNGLGLGGVVPTSTLHVVGTVAITGTLATQNGIAVGGVSAPTATLHVGGTSTFSGTAAFLGNVFVGNAGQIRGPNGTAAAPTFASHSETGLGIYQQGTSTLGVTQALHIASTLHVTGLVSLRNPVAVGTVSTPTTTLHVGGTFHAGTTALFGNVILADTATLHVGGAIQVGEGLRVQNALAIGGVTTATSTVHVAGSFAATGAAVFQSTIAIGSVSTATATIHVGGTLAVVNSIVAASMRVADGAAGVPSITFESEAGNGLFRRAASFLGVSQNLHVAGSLHVQGSLVLGAHIVAVAAEGTGAANIEILAGDRSVYLIDCNDANGCTIQMGTTTPLATVLTGAGTEIYNISTNANTLTVADVAGVQHVGTSFTMSTADSISLRLITNRDNVRIWTERARSDN